MFIIERCWRLYSKESFVRSIFPALAGCILVYASCVPWLKDPNGKIYAAWDIPITIGWQFHTPIFSYGLLCFCCAIYVFLVACANWLACGCMGGSFARRPLKDGYVASALCCFLLVILFLAQFLMFDVLWIDQLIQHENQTLLINLHLGYNIYALHIRITPFSLDPLNLQDRVKLLVDQMSFGPLLVCLSAGILLSYRYSRLFKLHRSNPAPKKRHGLIWRSGITLAVVVCLGLLGRVPAAMVCEAEASASLTQADYAQASLWLDRALFFNPVLDQLSSYHMQRGQIRYFLYRDDQSDDSHAYLASIAAQQSHYPDAYQELLGVWKLHRDIPWITSEMDTILEQSAESHGALVNTIGKTPTLVEQKDDKALPQLQYLLQIDPANIYVHYALGRIEYDKHDYIDCIRQMLFVSHLSINQEIQSSAYTYIGVSEAGQGDYTASRLFLFKAVALDPHYYNNTAREELSGLR